MICSFLLNVIKTEFDMKKHSRLVERVVRPYLIFIALILAVAMIVMYFSVVTKLNYEAENAGTKIAETMARQVDTYIEEIDVLAQQVKRQPRIINIFYNLNNTKNDKSNFFNNNVLLGIDVSSILNGLITDRNGNFNISVYNGYGDFVSNQNYFIDKKKFQSTMENMNYAIELNQIEENDDKIITAPSENPWTESTREFITLKKSLKNDYSDTVCGIIEVRASVDRLEQMLHTEDNAEILICDRSNGKIIYPTVYTERERSEYSSAFVNNANWEIMIRTPVSNTKTNIIFILSIFVALYAILLVFVFLISRTIGKEVIKPISQLANHVCKIDAPDDKMAHINDDAIDEIKELEDSFEKMLERMNNSIIQEKKAYALALQAQMNPHFLYNMLAVISSAGSEAGCDSVSTMCVELSDMLRYVAAYQKVTVPLKEEILHTKNYLALMKSRYEDYFSYKIDVSDDLMNIPVPKLFIQPLAENCFIHAFKEKVPPWNIDIKMIGTKDRWELIIKDNGSGISEERIAEIKDKIDKALNERQVGNIGGLGIVNTIVRLTMTHNKNLKYDIYNDNGMEIKIVAGE